LRHRAPYLHLEGGPVQRQRQVEHLETPREVGVELAARLREGAGILLPGRIRRQASAAGREVDEGERARPAGQEQPPDGALDVGELGGGGFAGHMTLLSYPMPGLPRAARSKPRRYPMRSMLRLADTP